MIRKIAILFLICTFFWTTNYVVSTTQQIPRKMAKIEVRITSPQANAAWKKRRSYQIKWDKVGQPSQTVRIVLSNPEGTQAIRTIVDPAPNIGSYQWTVPGYIPKGRYKIMVRLSDTQISGMSAEFSILDEDLKAMPVDLSSKLVIVKKPQENRKYPPESSIPIEWETDLPREITKTADTLFFDIDLYGPGGATHIYNIAKREHWRSYHISGNRYRTNWFWRPTEGNKAIRTGNYKIKITPKYAAGNIGGMPGFSGRITLSRGIENVTVDLAPHQIRGRRSTSTQAFRMDGKKETDMLTQEVFKGRFDNKPGLARAGFAFHRWQERGGSIFGADWKFIGNIYRVQMVFPVEQEKRPGRALLKATLRLSAEDSALSPNRTAKTGHPVPQTCGRHLYYLVSDWSGRARTTPGFHIATLPNQEWYELDVTEHVQKWYNGSQSNHGFLLGSIVEEFTEDNPTTDMGVTQFFCVTWYKPVLILEFLQGKD